ncbi:hypothetical protein BC835DRAFT_1311457 [Cytidiella melzeri]|nr:hypothetical protein BC835DRAFT_1311457 [Cytidiella melzeri]
MACHSLILTLGTKDAPITLLSSAAASPAAARTTIADSSSATVSVISQTGNMALKRKNCYLVNLLCKKGKVSHKSVRVNVSREINVVVWYQIFQVTDFKHMCDTLSVKDHEQFLIYYPEKYGWGQPVAVDHIIADFPAQLDTLLIQREGVIWSVQIIQICLLPQGINLSLAQQQRWWQWQRLREVAAAIAQSGVAQGTVETVMSLSPNTREGKAVVVAAMPDPDARTMERICGAIDAIPIVVAIKRRDLVNGGGGGWWWYYYRMSLADSYRCPNARGSRFDTAEDDERWNIGGRSCKSGSLLVRTDQGTGKDNPLQTTPA